MRSCLHYVNSNPKKTLFCFSFLICVWCILPSTLPLLAQEKKEKDPTSTYRGTQYERPKTDQGTTKQNNLRRRLKTKREIKEDASMRSSYVGTERILNLPKLRGQKAQKLADYSGKISLNKVAQHKNRMANKDADMANYRGNIKMSSYLNIAKNRQKFSKQLAKYKGPVLVRVVRKPKGDITSRYTGKPTRPYRPAKYNRSNLKKGAIVKKSELPNYAKERKRKLKYDKGETSMWQRGSSVMPGSPKRELPKKQKGKKNKEVEEEVIPDQLP